MLRLSKDSDAGVRGCVARNEATSCDILRSMADDESEVVRGWLAVNFFVPADVMERLADDPSETVRSLVRWKAELAGSDDEKLAETLVANGYYLALGISILYFTILATAWALFSGPTHYISLATAAFFGIGAYTTAVLTAGDTYGAW